MNEEKTILLKTRLFNRKNRNLTIQCNISIRDEIVVYTFEKEDIARELYEKDKADGEIVEFIEGKNSYKHKFPKMSKKEIQKLLINQINNAGGTYKVGREKK